VAAGGSIEPDFRARHGPVASAVGRVAFCSILAGARLSLCYVRWYLVVTPPVLAFDALLGV